MAGSEALRQALVHPAITKITVLARRLPTPNPTSPKLTILQHSDFLSYPQPLLDQLAGADGVIWDLGISGIGAKGMKEDELMRVTKSYTMAAADAFAKIERDEGQGKFVFAYLSGSAVTQKEAKNWSVLAKIKGQTELALANLRDSLPTITTYSFRSGMIQPVSAESNPTFVQRSIYPILGSLLPSTFIRADEVANSMINVIVNGSSGEVAGWKSKGFAGDENAFTSPEMKKLAVAW